jgi:hypothetical protein
MKMPVICQIRLNGKLRGACSGPLEGLVMTTDRIRGQESVTMLTGCLRDKVALSSVVDRLYALDLSILSVEFASDLHA